MFKSDSGAELDYEVALVRERLPRLQEKRSLEIHVVPSRTLHIQGVQIW